MEDGAVTDIILLAIGFVVGLIASGLIFFASWADYFMPRDE